MSCGKRECVVEPRVLLRAGEHQRRHLLRAHLDAVDLDIGQLRAGDFTDAHVDGGQLHVRTIDGAVASANLLSHDLGIQLRDVVDDGFNGGLELAHALPVTRQQRHRERLHLFRNLRLQHLESLLALRGH